MATQARSIASLSHDVLIEDTEEGFDITIAVGTEEKPDVPIARRSRTSTRGSGPGQRRGLAWAWSSRRQRKILARTGSTRYG